MRWLILVLTVIGTVGVFATTEAGRAVLKRFGLRRSVPGAAPEHDVDYLLKACGGDRAEVERRLEAERARYPALGEAEHYRRAIRRVWLERDAGR